MTDKGSSVLYTARIGRTDAEFSYLVRQEVFNDAGNDDDEQEGPGAVEQIPQGNVVHRSMSFAVGMRLRVRRTMRQNDGYSA